MFCMSEHDMKEITIFARVVAKPINFPDDLKMLYHCLDERGCLTGKLYDDAHFRWDQVKRNFDLDPKFAKECEQFLSAGESIFLGNQEVTIEVED